MEAQVQQLKEALEALKQQVGVGVAQPPAKFVYAAKKIARYDGTRDKLDDWIQEARSTITNIEQGC